MSDKVVFESHVVSVSDRRWFFVAMDWKDMEGNLVYPDARHETDHEIYVHANRLRNGPWLGKSGDGLRFTVKDKAIADAFQPGAKVRVTIEVVPDDGQKEQGT